jgi:hypothetical protein
LIELQKYFINYFHTADTLKEIFECEELWEARGGRGQDYRNGKWYTLGTPLYMDLLSPDDWFKYAAKVEYFNEILYSFRNVFGLIFDKLPGGNDFKILADYYKQISRPGFHIFGSDKSLNYSFGRAHQDLQWKVLPKLPNFPFSEGQMRDHFSFTWVLRLPFMKGGLLWGETLEHELVYEESWIYIHSGQTKHMIAPYKPPILKGDYRITMQGHGFTVADTTYLYW